MRAATVLLLVAQAGCIHSLALEKQCRRITVGMPFATAYGMVDATVPWCKYHHPGAMDTGMDDCVKYTTEIPASLVWSIPVMGRIDPDQCYVDLNGSGRVESVRYSRAQFSE